MVGGVDDDVGGHCTLLCISVLKLDWLMITQSEKFVRLKCGSSTEYKLQDPSPGGSEQVKPVKPGLHRKSELLL